jgi:oligopeptide/dipeptide ABC transporter ATP-binding protein
MNRQPLVVLDDIRKDFVVGRGFLGANKELIHAIDGVSLTIGAGETLGLVGETGSGKSTLARAVLRLTKINEGRVTFDGVDVLAASPSELRALRRQMQLIFQDPYSALDPLMKIGQSMAAPLSQHRIGTKSDRQQRVVELLELVGLDGSFMDRYPHECSGGQLQRVVIARALSLGPRFLVCDEPTSSLDASIRAQILNLLVDLRRDLALTLLIISHDLRVVRYIADRVAVMYLGRIVEVGSRDDVFNRPLHPYSIALLSAISLSPGTKGTSQQIILQGEMPSPAHLPSGCRFRSRCWLYERLARPARCADEDPMLRPQSDGHLAACHFSEELTPAETSRQASPPQLVAPVDLTG